jgi:hypothetical protein
LRKQILNRTFSTEKISVGAGNRVTASFKAEVAAVEGFERVAAQAGTLQTVVGFEEGTFVGAGGRREVSEGP